MKILFISSGNNKYGISPIIKAQGDSLSLMGISLYYYAIKGTGLFGYLKNVLPLRKNIKNSDYDIIHAHYGFSGVVALLAKRKEMIILSYMGTDLLKESVKNPYLTLFIRLYLLLNRILANYFYNFIIVKSQQMSDKLPRCTSKAIVPNGVNLELFRPLDKEESLKKLQWDISKKYCLFSSDPSRKEKNFVLAEKALKIINDTNIVVIPLKGIGQDLLPLYYSAADLLLMTSIHEGSPNVIKEAMACNCPLVSTDVGDVRQLIDRVEGSYICSFDPSDVSDKISKSLAFNRRTNGRQKLIEMGLDQESVARKLISIYSEIVKG